MRLLRLESVAGESTCRAGLRGLAIAFLAVALLSAGCGDGGGTGGTLKDPVGVQLVSSSQQRESPQVDAGDIAEAVSGNTAFAFDLFHLLAASDEASAGDATSAGDVTSGNLVFSPYSVSTALALAYAGARGETASEMAATMHFTLPPDRLHPALNALDGILAGRRQEGTGAAGLPSSIPLDWRAVNQLWGQQGYEFLPAYLDLLAAQYGAGMRLVDFSDDPDGSRRTINEWVAGQTERRILDLLPPGSVGAQTVLALTNALYLSAPWQTPFLPGATREGDFHLLNGEVTGVSFMHQTGALAYGEGEGWRAAEIPYRGRQLAMLVIVPDEGRFAEVGDGLDGAGLDAVVASLAPQEMVLSLPKFEITTARSLRDALESLGMTQAFDMGSADFSGMDGTQSLFVSGVQHQAFVAVDEAGTVAAAATAMTMAASEYIQEPVPELRADRPFVWLIRDIETGAVLFLGQVVDPSA